VTPFFRGFAFLFVEAYARRPFTEAVEAITQKQNASV
jgi:hypothetical protein